MNTAKRQNKRARSGNGSLALNPPEQWKRGGGGTSPGTRRSVGHSVSRRERDCPRRDALSQHTMMHFQIERHAEVASTNDIALARGKAGAPEGTLILAEYQTAGRGRYGRHWTAPRGKCILASVILRHRLLRDEIALPNLIGALSNRASDSRDDAPSSPHQNAQRCPNRKKENRRGPHRISGRPATSTLFCARIRGERKYHGRKNSHQNCAIRRLRCG